MGLDFVPWCLSCSRQAPDTWLTICPLRVAEMNEQVWADKAPERFPAGGTSAPLDGQKEGVRYVGRHCSPSRRHPGTGNHWTGPAGESDLGKRDQFEIQILRLATTEDLVNTTVHLTSGG